MTPATPVVTPEAHLWAWRLDDGSWSVEPPAEGIRGRWRLCACDRSRPDHADAPPDPAGGTGCGMTYRVGEDDEHHITDHDERIHGPLTPPGQCPETDEPTKTTEPGGYLRQDVPAGPVLPHHQATGETAMVEPTRPASGGVPC